jgi:hypothetical protein
VRCFFYDGDPDDSPAFEQRVDWMLESGAISLGDAETVRTFAAFLQAAGRTRPIPLQVLRDFQEFLGISDERLAEIERERAEASG